MNDPPKRRKAAPAQGGDDLPIEPPTKAPDHQFTAKRPVSARSPA